MTPRLLASRGVFVGAGLSLTLTVQNPENVSVTMFRLSDFVTIQQQIFTTFDCTFLSINFCPFPATNEAQRDRQKESGPAGAGRVSE